MSWIVVKFKEIIPIMKLTLMQGFCTQQNSYDMMWMLIPELFFGYMKLEQELTSVPYLVRYSRCTTKGASVKYLQSTSEATARFIW